MPPQTRRVLPALGGADLSLRGLFESASSFGLFIKFLLVEVCLFYLLSYIDTLQADLSITPGSLIPSFKIWTLFTYALIDVHIWNLVRNVVVIFLAGKYIQPLWGDLELLLFYLITNTISGLWVTLLYLLSYMSVGNEEYLFETRICGLGAFVGGLLVALKQLLPEEVISSLPFLHIRVKHLPFTFFIISLIMVLLGVSSMPTFLLYVCGVLVSWIYLRFYQLHSSTRGDLSDGFTFASFFPEICQPAVAVVANSIHSVLVRVGLCRKMVRRYDMGAGNPAGGSSLSGVATGGGLAGYGGPPGTVTLTLTPAERADNDRRRQLALKALGERLGGSSSGPILPTTQPGGSVTNTNATTKSSEWPTIDISTSNTSAAQNPNNGSSSGPMTTTTNGSKNYSTGATQLDQSPHDPNVLVDVSIATTSGGGNNQSDSTV